MKIQMRSVICMLAVAAALLCLFTLPQTAQAASTSDLTFTLNDAGDGYVVSKCNTAATGELVIPDTYNGKPVTAIGVGAFARCTGLTSITIADSVTVISDDAFYGCNSLTAVTIGNGVTSIGYTAFGDCSKLTSVTIGDSVTSIGTAAFYGCTALNDITIPDSVTTISSNAFFECYNLAVVTIGNGVTSIGDEAFYGCAGLIRISMSDSITSIGVSAFHGCSSLTTVTYCGTQAQWEAIEKGSDNKPLTNATLQLHNYENGTCTACGFSNVLTFSLNDAGDGYIVSGYNRDTYGKLVIPATYNGLPVTGIADNVFYNCSGLTSITIPASVTSIGNFAFYACTNLKDWYITDASAWCKISFAYQSVGVGHCMHILDADGNEITDVVLDGTVTVIPENAFRGCTGLTSITIPDSVTSIGAGAFYNCDSLTSITIPDNVPSINSFAFYNCDSLTSITIPDSVTSIGDSAFSGCADLTNVIYCGTQEQWDAIAIGGWNEPLNNATLQFHNYENGSCTVCGVLDASKFLTFTLNDAGDGYIVSDCDTPATGELVIPATYNGKPVTAIGDYAFYKCTGLTSITIPDSVTSIGGGVFSGCTALKNITIPDSVTSIGNEAFYNCTGLTSATIGNGVTSIGDYAFDNCTGLTSATIGNGVTSIGDFAFYKCTGLTSITIPDSVTAISGYAFAYCTGLTSITIPDSVTSIGSYAFSGCSSLTSATIGNGVTSIGDFAFYKCTGLTSITIPDSVTSIGYYAFGYCSSLTSITIPDSVTSIDSNAFYHCRSLTSINIPDSVTSIGDYAFYHCTNLTSVIYCGTQKQWNSLSIGSDNEALTNAALQFHNYENGICTACGATQELTDANLKFYRANTSSPYGQLKLTGEVIAYVTAARKGYDSYYVVFTYDNQGNTVTVTAEPSSSSDANYVLFDCAIPAPLMTADITATIYGVKGGVAYQGETIVYTIRECVDAKLNMWYASYGKNAQIAKLFDTLVNLLNYGAQAQTRFGVNTDKLATDGLPAEYAAKIKTDPVELNAYPAVDESGKAATLYNMSFKLQEKINMYGNFLVKSGFTAASDYTVKIVHTKADGSTVTYTITDLTKSGNYLYFEFSKLAPAQMRDELQITLYQKGVAVSATYIRSGDRVVNTLPAPLAALANAIMHYSDCAKAAFG